MIMKDENPSAFEEGVLRVQREVERAEKSGNYRTYFSVGQLRVFFWEKEMVEVKKLSTDRWKNYRDLRLEALQRERGQGDGLP